MKLIRDVFVNVLSFFLMIFLLALGAYCLFAVYYYDIDLFLLAMYGVKLLLILSLLYIIGFILYKLFIEKLVLKKRRKQTIIVTNNKLGSDMIIEGPKGFGKDTLATAIGREKAKEFKDKCVLRMKEIRDIAYIFDFDRVDKICKENDFKLEFLNSSNRQRVTRFKMYFTENKGFLKQRYYHVINYSNLCDRYLNNKPSGYTFYTKVRNKDFFSLLNEYVNLFIRVYYIKQFMISNSQTLWFKKDLDGTDLGSLKHSFDNMKIKSTDKLLLIQFMVMIHTEATLFFNNADKKSESENKTKNGILEYFITIRHLLKEYLYIATSAAKDRTQLWYRELFSAKIVIHSKAKIKCTSKLTRFFIRLNINFLFIKRRIINEDSNRLYRIDKKIFKLKEKHIQLVNNGFLVFNCTTHTNPNESIKKRTLRAIIKKNEISNFKTSYVFKILDSWPYYDTEFFGCLIDELIEKSKLQIQDIPEWKKLKFDFDDARYINHPLLNEMMKKHN